MSHYIYLSSWPEWAYGTTDYKQYNFWQVSMRFSPRSELWIILAHFSTKGMCEACDVCTSIHQSCVAHFVQGHVSKLQVWWIGVGAYQRYKQSIPCAILCSPNLTSSSNALQGLYILSFHLLPANILEQFKIYSNKSIEDRICNLSAKLSWKEYQLSTNLFNNI